MASYKLLMLMEHFALMMYLMIFLLKQKIASINMSKREWSPGLVSLIRLNEKI